MRQPIQSNFPSCLPEGLSLPSPQMSHKSVRLVSEKYNFSVEFPKKPTEETKTFHKRNSRLHPWSTMEACQRSRNCGQTMEHCHPFIWCFRAACREKHASPVPRIPQGPTFAGVASICKTNACAILPARRRCCGSRSLPLVRALTQGTSRLRSRSTRIVPSAEHASTSS